MEPTLCFTRTRLPPRSLPSTCIAARGSFTIDNGADSFDVAARYSRPQGKAVLLAKSNGAEARWLKRVDLSRPARAHLPGGPRLSGVLPLHTRRNPAGARHVDRAGTDGQRRDRRQNTADHRRPGLRADPVVELDVVGGRRPLPWPRPGPTMAGPDQRRAAHRADRTAERTGPKPATSTHGSSRRTRSCKSPGRAAANTLASSARSAERRRGWTCPIDPRSSIRVIGPNDGHLVVQGRASCGGGQALFDYDPAANTSTVLLGPPLNGGGVIAAFAVARAGLAGPTATTL